MDLSAGGPSIEGKGGGRRRRTGALWGNRPARCQHDEDFPLQDDTQAAGTSKTIATEWEGGGGTPWCEKGKDHDPGDTRLREDDRYDLAHVSGGRGAEGRMACHRKCGVKNYAELLLAVGARQWGTPV